MRQFLLTPIILFAIHLGWFFALSAAGEQPSAYETGSPNITFYDPKTYGEHTQNWCIIRDNRGVVYSANGNGVLEYDGATWRLIETRNSARARSFAKGADGTIYVGASADFGYLAPDSIGEMRFVSLLNNVPENERDFSEVWRTHCTSDGAVYFQTFSKLFRWSNGKIKIWKTDPLFFLSHLVNDTLFIQQRNVGIFKLAGDSLQLIPGSEMIAGNGVFEILSIDAETRLFCVGKAGLYLHKNQKFTRFSDAATKFISSNQLSSAALLPDGRIVLGSYNAGAIIIDLQGNLQMRLDKSGSLPDDDIKHLYHDGMGSLWLGMNFGIAKIALPSQFSYFTGINGLEGNVENIIRHRGQLFVATGQGIYLLDPQSEKPFRQYGNFQHQSFHLLSTGKDLLAGTNNGVYLLENQQVKPISTNDETVFFLHRYQQNPNLIFAGHLLGLGVLRYENGSWRYVGKIDGISEEIRSIVENPDGSLWLGTMQKGVMRIQLDHLDREIPIATVAHFEMDMPLSTGQISAINNHVSFATLKGLRYFDEATQTLQPDSVYGAALADSTVEIYWLFETGDGNVIFRLGSNKTGHCWLAEKQPDGSYKLNKSRFREISIFGALDACFTDADGVIWFGCKPGIIRFDPAIDYQMKPQFPPLIRHVSIPKNNRHSLLFNGTVIDRAETPVLQYHDNALRFEFALPSFENEFENQFRFMLDGFDQGWSGWSATAKKDYTNLPEGDYVFRVQSRNMYRSEIGETSFAFDILPPWFRTWWAFLLYFVLGGIAIAGIVQIRVRQLKQQQEELEKIITMRTAQVVEQRNQLEQQSEKLKEMDELKSRFFANISHEFRTPLTLIMGLLDKLRRNTPTADAHSDLGMMRQNAARLLNLINELLDLSKLEAGRMELRAAKSDIVQFLRRIFASFASFAPEKEIELRFNHVPLTETSGQAAIFIYFDAEKLEKVFNNLLSNAFKFTPANGQIDVSIVTGIAGGGDEQPVVEIRITNTGPGIPPDKLENIFDRFYQVEAGTTRQFEGTGIGLALVKELVELHRGSVFVESEVDRETTFSVRLPFGAKHLRPEEIVEKSEATEEQVVPIVRQIPVKPVDIDSGGSVFQPDAASPVSKNTGDDCIVLVVEDHRDLRAFICEQLRPEFQVIEAENGRIGLEIAEAQIPDLIISDVMMPEMDGYQLCDALKSGEKTNHIPVILLTAKAATGDKIEGLETGADDYLVKPFDSQELVIRVRNLIRIREQMRQKFSSEMLLKPADVTVPSIHQEFLSRLIAIIEEHLDDENFSVEALSDDIGMSRAQLHRKLRAIANQSPSEFIRSFRLQRAAELIKQDAGNIAEIAYMVGFNSQAYFTRCFQEQFGCSPRDFKKSIQ
ncbi:MAG: ATP-binding protein [Calditrichia bacterium]